MDNNREAENNNNSSNNNIVVKGKRTKRQRPQSPIPFRVTTPSATSSESAATAPAAANTEEEEDMANCLIMLAQGRRFEKSKFTSRKFLESSPSGATVSAAPGGGYYVYECKTCSKTFSSFQALGGHRASHKKPKLPPKDNESSRPLPRQSNNLVLSDEDEPTTMIATSSLSLQLTNGALYTAAAPATPGQKAARVHECSICGAEFASGQALGGHMRRHRGPPSGSQPALTLHEEKTSPSTSSAVEPTLYSKKPSLDLDLNLPAMPDVEEVNADAQPQQPTQPPAQQIVFSPPPALVDCHY